MLSDEGGAARSMISFVLYGCEMLVHVRGNPCACRVMQHGSKLVHIEFWLRMMNVAAIH